MRETARPAHCQVNSCNAALSSTANRYCWKKRACPDCLKAPIVTLGDSDEQQRFCQQCGRFQPLSLFDGASAGDVPLAETGIVQG
ncbi:hypothetical protein OEZ85_009968 [Tetradesmus obliquus]|uniref:SBP-type domain-containing protein n=1 Tax=Tetradesmus obliquus TaxID=3088 RepID=A0ABY8UCY4_TETOB|nr:hypothetical protein OEZ85_009968 [Tetradesmus obliquus]